MVAEQEIGIRIGKANQINAPSNAQIIQLMEEMIWRISRRRKFLGQTISKQTFLNAILLGLASEGPKTWDYIFDVGATILAQGIQAGEPGIPIVAGRPLKKRFQWFTESGVKESDEEPEVTPLASTELPPELKSDQSDNNYKRRGKSKD